MRDEDQKKPQINEEQRGFITLHNIIRDFSDGRIIRRVIQPTNLDIKPAQLTVLSGPSGSGKTTLLSIMGLVLQPSSGKVILENQEISGMTDDEIAEVRYRKFGYVFQQAALIQGLNAVDNILLAVALHGEGVKEQKRQKAYELLMRLGMQKREQASVHQLSGGERQRIAIARALLRDPAVILCDEPTSALDAESGRAVMEILKEIAVNDRRSVVVVSHDSRVFPYADRLLKMENGVIISDNLSINFLGKENAQNEEKKY